jgi:hypothetical protein
MINRDNTSSITLLAGVMGILMDNELLLLEAVQGKQVLRSLRLPAEVSEPGRLLKYLWDAGLHSAWVMPATSLSRTATCSWLEQASSYWVVSVHPAPQEPTRPVRALLWPRERNQWEARRLALAFPEYAGWGWELTDARRVQVREGWYWQEAHDLLKRWGTTLWQAASRLHIHPQVYRHALGRANALHTITRLAELGISILAQEQTVGGWSRPDWWVQVIGLGRALLFAQLGSLVSKGTMPVLVDRDAFWVISDEAQPLSAVPGLLAAQRWRGYTAGYQAPLLLTSEVRDAFQRAQHAGELALALDTLVGEVRP